MAIIDSKRGDVATACLVRVGNGVEEDETPTSYDTLYQLEDEKRKG